MTAAKQGRQPQALLDLRAELRRLHIQAGEPSVRAMAASIGDVSHSTIQVALRGTGLPRWPILEKIVRSLDGDVGFFRSLWLDARGSQDESAPKPSDTARRTVYLSWSGGASEGLAKALGSWLPQVIQNVQVNSPDKFGGGYRWADELRTIEDSDVAVLCLTPGNIHSPWMAFEAGAISRGGASKVIPLLFNISPHEITGPLATFQALSSDKDGIYRLIEQINSIAHVGRVPGDTLRAIFEVLWPKLESELIELQNQVRLESNRGSTQVMLEELVVRVRELERHMIGESQEEGTESLPGLRFGGPADTAAIISRPSKPDH
jgi:hypothetical protein